MKKFNRTFVFFIVFVIVGCGSTPSMQREQSVDYQPTDPVVTQLPKLLQIKKQSGSVPFYGVLTTKPEDNSQSMMYSGDAGLVGLIAQVMVHGAIANNAENTKLSNAQKLSDQVLNEYRPYIEQNTYEHLLTSVTRGFATSEVSLSLVGEATAENNGLVIETSPVFYLSQDENSIIIEHQAKAFYANFPEVTVFENAVKVISPSIKMNKDFNPWLKNDGEKFFVTTSDLYDKSLHLLVKDMYKTLPSSDKKSTYKYYIGNSKHYIRASLIEDHCASTAVRDLKGNIVVLPKRNQKACDV